MEGNWDLDRLYTSFQSLKYEKDLERLRLLAEKIKAFNEENAQLDKTLYIRDYLKLTEKFQLLYSRLYSYASFRCSVKVNDRDALTQASGLEAMSGSLAYQRALFVNFLGDIPDMDRLCREEEEIGRYEYYLKKLQEEGEYQLSPKEEALLAVMTLTGSKAFCRLQNKVSAGGIARSIEADMEPERSFQAELAGYKRHEEVSAAALNSVKGEVIAVTGLRGYDSPLHRSLAACHMDGEILDCLLKSVEEYLPRLCRYYKIKAGILGYPLGLPYHLRETSIIKEQRSYDIGEARNLILGAFEGFSSKMYQFGKKAFEDRWIDYSTAEDKAAGASCDGIYALGESRIRLHYNGTLSDVNTLAHELGHGYHNLNLFEEGILNYSYDLPMAETAAKFSEILFKETLKKQLPGGESLYLKDFIVAGFVNTLVDIQSRFYFEDELFAIRKVGEPGPEELCSLMRMAQIRCYGDSLDERLLNPYMWLNKPHYYFADRSYYNFPYSFGTLLSIGMYRRYAAEPEAFVKAYDVFLRSTGKQDVYNLCGVLGIDVKDKGFFRETLEYIVGQIDELGAALERGI